MASSAVAASCVVVALLLATVPGAVPQPGGASSSCTGDLLRLLPCLSFVGGNVAAPSDTCCANLGSMVHDEPLCLCQALSQQPGHSVPVPVNMTRAAQLPRLCRLQLPPAATACPGLVPGGAPPPPPPVSVPRPTPNASSTAPSTETPVMPPPPPPQATLPPRTSSQQMPEYSTGIKMVVSCAPVALGFMALLSALAF
ncbi:non-specific lipid transfer protein GPI-anchored 5-like [Oryza brachyantha]|uniref:Bifunctional inhibitor/plant lipid transfer protein/seed storage helical domain-containing protein n=1 Tax=Oryza brachyantha TaxID=4533 RepID=J3LYL4_ORYBR|nr:non-specific lipid transfer protein GPI-anchored 5-like [Oryza brachyantha]